MKLRELQEQGMIDSAEEAAASLNHRGEEELSTPLLARVALVIGAWLSGIFLSFFFGLLFQDIFDTPPVPTFLGLFVIAGSLLLFRKTSGLFLEQLALAINFAGTVLFVVGTAAWSDDFMTGIGDEILIVLIAVTLLCPFVFLLSKNPVQQFISLGWVFTFGWIETFEEASTALLLLLLTLSLLLFLFSWLRNGGPILNASTKFASLASCLAALFLLSASIMGWNGSFLEPAIPIIRTLVPLSLGGVLIWLHWGCDGKRILGCVAFTILLFAISWAGAPGVAFALGLMVLSHLVGDRFLAGLAPVLLAGFLILFYYFLGVPLLTKSLWLLGIGAALLVNCTLLLRVLRPRLYPS